jgi:hypothetical protein
MPGQHPTGGERSSVPSALCLAPLPVPVGAERVELLGVADEASALAGSARPYSSQFAREITGFALALEAVIRRVTPAMASALQQIITLPYELVTEVALDVGDRQSLTQAADVVVALYRSALEGNPGRAGFRPDQIAAARRALLDSCRPFLPVRTADLERVMLAADAMLATFYTQPQPGATA